MELERSSSRFEASSASSFIKYFELDKSPALAREIEKTPSIKRKTIEKIAKTTIILFLIEKTLLFFIFVILKPHKISSIIVYNKSYNLPNFLKLHPNCAQNHLAPSEHLFRWQPLSKLCSRNCASLQSR